MTSCLATSFSFEAVLGLGMSNSVTPTDATFEPQSVTYRSGLVLMDTAAACAPTEAVLERLSPWRVGRFDALGLSGPDPLWVPLTRTSDATIRVDVHVVAGPVPSTDGAHFLSAIDVSSGRLSATWADTIEAAGWPDEEYIGDIGRCSLEVPNGRHLCLVRRSDSVGVIDVTIYVGAESDSQELGWLDLDAVEVPTNQPVAEPQTEAAPSEKPWWKFWG